MYGFHKTLTCSFEEAIEKVTAALKQEGFGVLTEINVKETLKAKLGIEKRPYMILGACNPPLANQVLEIDPDIGMLLPCNVVVREEENGSITVAFLDPKAILGLVEKPAIESIAMQVRAKLENVKNSLN